MATINIGIIGYGFRGRVLAGACRAVDRLKIAAVAEMSAAGREAAAREIEGVRLFERFEDMLDFGARFSGSRRDPS